MHSRTIARLPAGQFGVQWDSVSIQEVLCAAKVTLCLTGAVFLGTASYSFYEVGRQVKLAINELSSTSATQLARALDLVDSHLSQTQSIVDGRTKDALARVDAAITLVDRRSKEISDGLTAAKNTGLAVGLNLAGRVDSRLGEVTREIKEFRMELTPAIASASSTLFQIQEAAPLFLDCDHNVDCAFNRYVGVSKAAEATMVDISSSVPTFIDIADKVGQNIEAGSKKYLEVGQDTDTFIQRMTPPKFPTWLRWTLGIAPPVAATGASVVGIGAITGRFK